MFVEYSVDSRAAQAATTGFVTACKDIAVYTDSTQGPSIAFWLWRWARASQMYHPPVASLLSQLHSKLAPALAVEIADPVKGILPDGFDALCAATTAFITTLYRHFHTQYVVARWDTAWAQLQQGTKAVRAYWKDVSVFHTRDPLQWPLAVCRTKFVKGLRGDLIRFVDHQVYTLDSLTQPQHIEQELVPLLEDQERVLRPELLASSVLGTAASPGDAAVAAQQGSAYGDRRNRGGPNPPQHSQQQPQRHPKPKGSGSAAAAASTPTPPRGPKPSSEGEWRQAGRRGKKRPRGLDAVVAAAIDKAMASFGPRGGVAATATSAQSTPPATPSAAAAKAQRYNCAFELFALTGVSPSAVSQALMKEWVCNDTIARVGIDTCSGVNVVTIGFLLRIPANKQPLIAASAYSVVGGGGKMTVLGAVELQIALPTRPEPTIETTPFLVVDWLPHTVDALVGRAYTKRHDMVIHELSDQVEFSTVKDVQASGLQIPPEEQYASVTNPETKPVSFYAQYTSHKHQRANNPLPARKHQASS